MYMSSVATELAADSPSYKSDRGKMTFKQFVGLFPRNVRNANVSGWRDKQGQVAMIMNCPRR